MGRRKKTATIDKDIAAFEADKTAALDVFNKKKSVLSKEIAEMFDMRQVRSPSEMKGYIQHFCEETYEQSLKAAYVWRDRENSKNSHKINLISYYPQIMGGKSILVNYSVSAG
jgi:hypothetical protein